MIPITVGWSRSNKIMMCSFQNMAHYQLLMSWLRQLDFGTHFWILIPHSNYNFHPIQHIILYYMLMIKLMTWWWRSMTIFTPQYRWIFCFNNCSIWILHFLSFLCLHYGTAIRFCIDRLGCILIAMGFAARPYSCSFSVNCWSEMGSIQCLARPVRWAANFFSS